MLWSHRKGHLSILEKQLERGGIEYVSEEVENFSWRTQQLHLLNVAKRYSDDLLISLGAWDTVFLGTMEEIEALSLRGHITLGAQKYCWPDSSRQWGYERKNPNEKSPWRYVNTGPIAGLGKDISEAIEWGWERFPIIGDSIHVMAESDMQFWSNLYLSDEFDIRLDTECRLNQMANMSKVGELYVSGSRIVNSVHNTAPIFFHANNKSPIPVELVG